MDLQFFLRNGIFTTSLNTINDTSIEKNWLQNKKENYTFHAIVHEILAYCSVTTLKQIVEGKFTSYHNMLNLDIVSKYKNYWTINIELTTKTAMFKCTKITFNASHLHRMSWNIRSWRWYYVWLRIPILLLTFLDLNYYAFILIYTIHWRVSSTDKDEVLNKEAMKSKQNETAL